LDQAKFENDNDIEKLRIFMEGLKGGVELTYIIADMLKIHLEISADGFSEYFAKYHIKEHEAAAE